MGLPRSKSSRSSSAARLSSAGAARPRLGPASVCSRPVCCSAALLFCRRDSFVCCVWRVAAPIPSLAAIERVSAGCVAKAGGQPARRGGAHHTGLARQQGGSRHAALPMGSLHRTTAQAAPAAVARCLRLRPPRRGNGARLTAMDGLMTPLPPPPCLARRCRQEDRRTLPRAGHHAGAERLQRPRARGAAQACAHPRRPKRTCAWPCTRVLVRADTHARGEHTWQAHACRVLSGTRTCRPGAPRYELHARAPVERL